jgi:hypothetical protein
MKKLMCVFLVLMLLFPYSAALADTQYYDYSSMSTTQLQKAAVNARTDAEATAIFQELLSRTSNSTTLDGRSLSASLTSSSLLNTYVRSNSVTTSSSSISVNYTVLAIIPSGASIYVGYIYPASTRTSGGSSLSSRSKGTYTKSFSGPFLPCGVRVQFKMTASSYNETKALKTYINLTGSSTKSFEITQSHVNANTINATISNVAIILIGSGSSFLLKWVVAPALTLSATAFSNPAMAVGQYYRITRTVSGSTLTITTRIWSSLSDYNNGAAAIGSSSSSFSIPTF